jgi:hypothetical protein
VTGLGAPLWRELASSIIGSPTLSLPRFSRTRAVSLRISTPTGMRYSRWKAGVAPEPDGCSSGTTATKPSAVTAPRDGKVRIWVEGQTSFYCFTDSATTFVDTHDPVAVAHASRTGARKASFTWSGSDAAPASGVKRYSVKVFRSGTTSAVYSQSFTSPDGVVLNGLSRGHTYTLRVTAKDRAGNLSDVDAAKVEIPRG